MSLLQKAPMQVGERMTWYKILICVAPKAPMCDRRVMTKAKQHTHRCHGHRMHILAKQWVDE